MLDISVGTVFHAHRQKEDRREPISKLVDVNHVHAHTSAHVKCVVFYARI